MIHLSTYNFKDNADGISRLNSKTVQLDIPKFWNGYYALFAPNTAPKKTKYFCLYWFASDKSKAAQNAIHILKN